jgi:hypothetical protein
MPPALSLSWSVDLEIPEDGAYFDPDFQYLTVSRVGNSTGALNVEITCSPTGKFSLRDSGSLPQVITIPEGSPSAVVKLLPINDTVYTGNILVLITASASGHTSGITSATIREDDPAPTAPSNLSYSPSTISGTVGTAISSLTPTVTGTVTSYAISPALPAGLAISESTGVISGTPSAVAASATYTVTAANNAGGSTTTTVTVVVTPAGSTFAGWSGGAELNAANVGKYAIGGATNSSAASERPVAGVDSNVLLLTAIVRTNDGKLSVVGEAGGSLTNWSSNGVSVTASTNTNGVPDGCQRQVFSVERASDPRKFLRLKATLAP